MPQLDTTIPSPHMAPPGILPRPASTAGSMNTTRLEEFMETLEEDLRDRALNYALKETPIVTQEIKELLLHERRGFRIVNNVNIAITAERSSNSIQTLWKLLYRQLCDYQEHLTKVTILVGNNDEHDQEDLNYLSLMKTHEEPSALLELVHQQQEELVRKYEGNWSLQGDEPHNRAGGETELPPEGTTDGATGRSL